MVYFYFHICLYTAIQISQYTVYDECMAELTGRVTGYQSKQQ